MSPPAAWRQQILVKSLMDVIPAFIEKMPAFFRKRSNSEMDEKGAKAALEWNEASCDESPPPT